MALALGRTVAELDDTLTAEEWLDWLAYSAVEPFGPPRGDLQAGIVASVVVNALRGKKGKTVSPTDFLLQFRPGEGEIDLDVGEAGGRGYRRNSNTLEFERMWAEIERRRSKDGIRH